jgi:hypothetical protein
MIDFGPTAKIRTIAAIRAAAFVPDMGRYDNTVRRRKACKVCPDCQAKKSCKVTPNQSAAF